MQRTAAIVMGVALTLGGLGGARLQTDLAVAQDATPVAEQVEHPVAVIGTGDVVTPVLVSLVGGDTAAVRGSDGRYHVVYELLLINTAPSPASLEAIAVLDAAGGAELLTLTDEEIIAGEMLRTLDREPVADTSLDPNEALALLLGVSFATEEEVPAALTHRFDILSPSPFAAEPVPFRYEAGTLDLSRRTPPVLSPPLAGEGWVASDGCCDPASHHRNGLFPINGWLHAGQRFAIDWMRIDDEGRLAAGDPSDITTWAGYGAPVLAAGDGVVIVALDGLEDQVPGVMPDQGPMSLDEADGNHVVIDHGAGYFSFYAHLQPGSVAVNAGDRVAAGDQLGLLGNSGASGAPHLHFHVMSGPSPSGSDGLPYVIDAFQVGGTADPNGLLGAIHGEAAFPPRAELTPVAHENELPLSYTIVDFPNP